MKEILKSLSAPLLVFSVIVGLTYLVSGVVSDSGNELYENISPEEFLADSDRNPDSLDELDMEPPPSLKIKNAHNGIDNEVEEEPYNNVEDDGLEPIDSARPFTGKTTPKNLKKKGINSRNKNGGNDEAPENKNESESESESESENEDNEKESEKVDDGISGGAGGGSGGEEEANAGSGESSGEESSSAPPPMPPITVAADKNPGTYKYDPLITLTMSGPGSAYYCIQPNDCGTSMCDPVSGGTLYSGAFNLGSTPPGPENFCLSFYAKNIEGLPTVPTDISFTIDENAPDLNVTSTRYLQSTEYLKQYEVTSTDFGATNFYYWLLNIPGSATTPGTDVPGTDLTNCAADSNQGPQAPGNDIVFTYPFATFGMDLDGDASKDLVDLSTEAGPISKGDYYRGKNTFAYGDNYLVSVMVNDVTLDYDKYSCNTTNVILKDFDYTNWSTPGNVPISGSGEMEFTGSFTGYQGGVYDSTPGDPYDNRVIESGMFTITN